VSDFTHTVHVHDLAAHEAVDDAGDKAEALEVAVLVRVVEPGEAVAAVFEEPVVEERHGRRLG
jgi:hypothetical protein